MSKTLDAGDLVRMDFSPQRGHEQRGWRPALVLSPAGYHQISKTVIVCPITSNLSPWEMKAILPDGLVISGAVLLDQIKSLDRQARGLQYLGSVPNEFLVDVRARLGAFLSIQS